MNIFDLGEVGIGLLDCKGTLGVCAPSELLVGTSRFRASCCGGALAGGSVRPTAPPYKWFQIVSRDSSRAAIASLAFGPEACDGGDELGPLKK